MAPRCSKTPGGHRRCPVPEDGCPACRWAQVTWQATSLVSPRRLGLGRGGRAGSGRERASGWAVPPHPILPRPGRGVGTVGGPGLCPGARWQRRRLSCITPGAPRGPAGARGTAAHAGRAPWRDSSRTSSVRTKAAVRPRVPGPGSSAEEPAGPATGRVRATRWTRELSSQGRQGDARTRPLGSRCRRGRPFHGEGEAGQALGPQRGGTTWVLASETQATSARCLGATRQGQEVWRGQERCPLKRSASVPRPSSSVGRPRCDQGPGARRLSVSAERSGATCHGAVSGAADSHTQPVCCNSGSVRPRRAVN